MSKQYKKLQNKLHPKAVKQEPQPKVGKDYFLLIMIGLTFVLTFVGWEHFARRLANEKRMIFVTGSNAKMLSREVATTLGGRFLMLDVAPYSFAEYLRTYGISLGKNWRYGKTASDVERRFETYLRFGGLPSASTHPPKV